MNHVLRPGRKAWAGHYAGGHTISDRRADVSFRRKAHRPVEMARTRRRTTPWTRTHVCSRHGGPDSLRGRRRGRMIPSTCCPTERPSPASRGASGPSRYSDVQQPSGGPMCSPFILTVSGLPGTINSNSAYSTRREAGFCASCALPGSRSRSKTIWLRLFVIGLLPRQRQPTPDAD